MIDHIRDHLQSIALLSLPWLDNVYDDSDTDTDSVKPSSADSENDALLGVSLQFSDPGTDHRPGDEVIPPVSVREPIEDHWALHAKYYGGHERDPVLQPFLRKLYLGLSPNTSTRGPVLPCYFMPRKTAQRRFTRKSVLDTLAIGLCPSQIPQSPTELSLRSYALCGPGGMGKTYTASDFVNLYHEEFEAVFWVHADSQAKLLQDFRDIAVKLGLVAEDSVDANDQILTRNLLKTWLINPRKIEVTENERTRASWLLVFDGVNDPDLLQDAWPYGGPGSILVTSRDPLPFESFSKIIRLLPLGLDDAVQFLLYLTRKENDASETKPAQAVVKRLGGIPLVLAQMAGMISSQRWSMSDFLLAYGKRESVDEASPQSVHKHSLASVWALESLKHSRGLLNVLSMLDPDAIPEQILITHIPDSRQEGYPGDIKAFHRAKYELLSSSLLSEDKEKRHLWLHRICQDVARNQMDSYTYRETFFECVRLVSAAWPYELFTWRHGVERWATCAALFPHVAWLLDLAEPGLIYDETIEGDYKFAKLLTDAGWYHHERGHSDESVRFSDIALVFLNRLLAGWSLVVSRDKRTQTFYEEAIEATIAEIYHNKGCFATEINQPTEALKCHSKFHEMMMDKIGAAGRHKDMRLAISWNELGNAYMLNNSWTQGKECFERSIADMRLLDDFDVLQLSLPLANLGLAYWVIGRLEMASKILTGALAEREAVFGPDDRDSFITGRILHALGNVKYSQGLHEDSFSLHRRALLQYKSTLGINHHRTADLCVKVAVHHLRLRHWELARALLKQALMIYDESDVFLPERIRVLFNQCRVYRALKKDERAATLEEDLMRLYRRLTRDDQRDFRELNDQLLDNLIVFWSR
ncbi:hypothetical protein BDV97DRAFT_305597 [Delphinella strobiligena]|nr:hypothetical protein BDV97DRAFT_305597 [Delphinella strobiligena]